MSTKVSYMYRDGANYKSFNEVILSGEITEDDLDKLEYYCPDFTFIAHQIGIPALCPCPDDEDFNEEFDHPWHEFCDGRNAFEITNKPPTENMSIENLINRIETADLCIGWDTDYSLWW